MIYIQVNWYLIKRYNFVIFLRCNIYRSQYLLICVTIVLIYKDKSLIFYALYYYYT